MEVSLSVSDSAFLLLWTLPVPTVFYRRMAAVGAGGGEGPEQRMASRACFRFRQYTELSTGARLRGGRQVRTNSSVVPSAPPGGGDHSSKVVGPLTNK